MATLLWQARDRTLNNPIIVIGTVKLSYFYALRDLRFTDVSLRDFEVTGIKSGCRLSIVHLRITNQNYHEVFMVGGDSENEAQRILAEAVEIKLIFL